jgi:hypothetical protein
MEANDNPNKAMQTQRGVAETISMKIPNADHRIIGIPGPSREDMMCNATLFLTPKSATAKHIRSIDNSDKWWGSEEEKEEKKETESGR